MAALSTHRELHFTEAVRETEERGEIIVGLGDMVAEGHGDSMWVAIVAWVGGAISEASLVVVVPPVGFGPEMGVAFRRGFRYLGWISDFTIEELDTLPDEVIENAPEQVGAHAFALDASRWRKFEAPYWEWFRSAAA
ncbi:hypothetical protein [Nocardia africana]